MTISPEVILAILGMLISTGSTIGGIVWAFSGRLQRIDDGIGSINTWIATHEKSDDARFGDLRRDIDDMRRDLDDLVRGPREDDSRDRERDRDRNRNRGYRRGSAR